MRTACAQARAWEELGGTQRWISVNVSARQLSEPFFVGSVHHILNSTELEPDRLILEITESAMVPKALISLGGSMDSRLRCSPCTR